MRMIKVADNVYQCQDGSIVDRDGKPTSAPEGIELPFGEKKASEPESQTESDES